MKSYKICGIIGYPLKKPRSIPIWKNYFKKNKINASMNKFEVQPKNLKKFIKYMKKNQFFLAAAITMPYKIILYNHVIVKDEFAKFSKSINLIYKKDNKLYGFNTDIYGAITSIKKIIKNYKNIYIFGLGGTGQAIFNYLIRKYPKKKYLLITRKNIKTNKNIVAHKRFSRRLIKNRSLLINCTPLGSNLRKNYLNKTPINDRIFKYIDKNSTIFDIVYSPKITKLNKQSKKYGVNYLNGLLMNTAQAKRALKIVFKN